MGLTNLPQPKNEYQIVMQPVLEDNEEAGQQALLGKKSLEVLDMSENGDKRCTFPPNSIQQADGMVRKELLSLQQHDNADCLINEKVVTAFEEDELMEADSMIAKEARYVGEAQKSCLNCLSSIAEDKENPVAGLLNEFEKVQNELEKVKKKAERIENRDKLRTHGYEERAKDVLWPKIGETFKQMDMTEKELECFQALQKKEKLAATCRINNMWEDVLKQKELEQTLDTLQKRYGDVLVELEKVQHQSKGAAPILIF